MRAPGRLRRLAAFALSLCGWGGGAWAVEIPVVVPLAVHVAEVAGPAADAAGSAADVAAPTAAPPAPVPVRDRAWVDAQIAEANRLMAPAGVEFVARVVDTLPERHARLETRADRDALGRLGGGAKAGDGAPVDVFIVESLRDVDEPPRLRMGVHWRQRSNRARRYVILAASASATVLAHELGHYFGNPHTQVVDNVMSYQRSDPAKMSFDETQVRRIRRAARRGPARSGR